MKKTMFLSAFLLSVTLSSHAADRDISELSKPIVTYTVVVNKHADALNLNETQRQQLKEWLATSPPQRMALEDKAVELRAQMRTMIANGDDIAKRKQLAKEIGQTEEKLIQARSNCADHWRKVLTPEQFAQMLVLSKPTAP